MKKTIHLWDENWNRESFTYELLSELSLGLSKRFIIIKESASIGNNVSIGYKAFIGNKASIGDEASIGYNASIVNSLFITGSKHTVCWYSTGFISIGCHYKSIKEWLELYKSIGESQSYSDEQIQEYLGYILICDQLQSLIK